MKMKTIIALLMCTCLAIAQDAKQTYEIPFPEGTSASKGNVIELSVTNCSTLTAEGVTVEVTSVPQGIKFAEKTVTITTLKAKEEQTVSFGFSVEKTAVINKEQTLSFTIYG
jgi:3,4-dihydroxy-2-butanone 4-phosphate synthase